MVTLKPRYSEEIESGAFCSSGTQGNRLFEIDAEFYNVMDDPEAHAQIYPDPRTVELICLEDTNSEQ